ncbi:MAG: hypothetical protein V4521_12510 [Pseudomonadota bacterium]
MAENALTNVPVLILGESHCTAISRAIGDDIRDKFVAVDVRIGADTSKINFDLFSDFCPSNILLSFGGTEHNIVGLIEAEPRFDFLWPPFDDFDDGRCLVPASAIEELIAYRVQSGLRRAMLVRERFSCPTFALAPPPPFRSIDEKTQLPQAFTTLLEAGIAPPALRRKLYAVQCEVMRRQYEALDIPFIPAPATATDEEGYLLRKFWNRDPTHGNPAYGRLVIKHLRGKFDV